MEQNVDIEFNLSAEWYGDGAVAAAQGMTIHADGGCGSSLIDPVDAHNVVLNPVDFDLLKNQLQQLPGSAD